MQMTWFLFPGLVCTNSSGLLDVHVEKALHYWLISRVIMQVEACAILSEAWVLGWGDFWEGKLQWTFK